MNIIELFKRLIRRIDKVMIACWIGLLLCAVLQCFVFSKDADLVGLRHYDDLAFHLELNRYYTEFSLDTLIKLNGYGYGWIYWLLVMVYCLPGWLLCRNYGISWLLMVTPRLMSVVLSATSVLVFYKLISLYTKDNYIRAAALFLMPLFPTLNFYSSLFSCNPHVAFFGILAVYLLAGHEAVSDVDLRLSLLCLALAGGIKITAVLILPIWGLLLLNRYGWHLSLNDIKKLCLNGLAFFALCVFFISPQFYIGMFKKEYLHNILLTLSWATSFGSEGDSGFLVNIKDGVIKSTYFIPVYVILFALILLLIYRKGIEKSTLQDILKNDFFCYFVGYIVAVALLCLKIQHGTLFITYYYTAICFVLPLGLVYLEKIKGNKIILMSLFLVQCLFIVSKVRSNASDNFFAYYEHYVDLKESGSMKEIVYLRDKIFDGLEEGNAEIRVAFDGSSPHFINPTKHQNVQIYTIWQDFAQQSENIEPDAIVMTKNWLSEQYKLDHYEDYMARTEFIRTGSFHNDYFIQAAETENYLLFLKEDRIMEKQKWKYFLGGGIACIVIYLMILGIYTRVAKEPIIFFASILIAGITVIVVCFQLHKISQCVYDRFTLAMVAVVYFIGILFLAVFGPTFIDRSISYHIAFYAAEEEAIDIQDVQEVFSQEIFDKRMQDAVKTGFLEVKEDGCYFPTWKAKVMAKVLIPLGKLTNSIDTYEQMKLQLARGE